jgi:hypothetical protein
MRLLRQNYLKRPAKPGLMPFQGDFSGGIQKRLRKKKQLAAEWRGNRLRREEERHRDPTQPPSLFGKLWGYYINEYRQCLSNSQCFVIDKSKKLIFILDKVFEQCINCKNNSTLCHKKMTKFQRQPQ